MPCQCHVHSSGFQKYLPGALPQLSRLSNSLIIHEPESENHSLACLNVINPSDLLVIFTLSICYFLFPNYVLGIFKNPSVPEAPQTLKNILPSSKKIIFKCIKLKTSEI